MDRPPGIIDFTPSREHFPFESRWFDSSVGPVHYVDEGEGRPILLLHGNPDWSFLYRRIIRGLRGRFRCVAPDYPGFGLSVHPDGYGYTGAEHSDVVGELVDHLDLSDLIVMGQDWGGPIGMDVASRRRERVSGLVMGNTWFWPADSRTMKVFGTVMASPPMQWLITRRNFFVSPIMKRSLQSDLTAVEFAHYIDVVPTPASRRGIAEFPKQILDASAWLAELEQRVNERLLDVPVLLVWGMADPALGTASVIDRWTRTFPDARFVELAGAGHYIQEDAPDEIVAHIIETFDS